MVDAPCSRVAHIYRCKYMPFKNGGKGDFVSRNYKRVAEVCRRYQRAFLNFLYKTFQVWMDDYKHNLYKHRPGVGDADTGVNDGKYYLLVRPSLISI